MPPPPPPPYNSPADGPTPQSYPRFLSFLLSIILGSPWLAWLGPLWGDFGVVSGRKRQSMLTTPSRGGVGSAPQPVWPIGIFEKRRTSAAKRCFFKKTCRWTAFLPFSCFSLAGPGDDLTRPGAYKLDLCLTTRHLFAARVEVPASSERKQTST